MNEHDDIVEILRDRALWAADLGVSQRAIDEIERLRTIVDTMMKTEDGVTIVPGMRVFFRSLNLEAATEGVLVAMVDCALAEEGEDGPFDWTAWWFEPGEGHMALPDDFGLYSSRAALEAAEAAKKGK